MRYLGGAFDTGADGAFVFPDLPEVDLSLEVVASGVTRRVAVPARNATIPDVVHD